MDVVSSKRKEDILMYNCRNCGGNLRFDIPTQRLKCPFCDNDYDCYDVERETISPNADLSTYDVTVFTCPQCGGEIAGSDQSVADFCSYCGQSVVLESRLQNRTRPGKIIPFKKTSEDCINAYRAKLNKSVFAPSALKKPEYLEQFRGIYIPYWSYGFTQSGSVSVSGTEEHRSGDYDVTEHYRLTGELEASFDGICYDASSSFDDSISEALKPFDPRDMKPFVPSYLSGFYADVADVDSAAYMDEANDFANRETLAVISGDKAFRQYDVKDLDSVQKGNKLFNTVKKEPEGALFPVWFLTWRDKDRVAYTTVNGQTGKMAADIPIDRRKYLAASLLFAIPLYFILDFFFSFKASTSLFLAEIFALIAGIIYYWQIDEIIRRHQRVEDRGLTYLKNLQKRKEAEAKEAEAKDASQSEKKPKSQKGKKKQSKPAKKEKGSFPAALLHGLTIISILLAIFEFAYIFFTKDVMFGAFFNRYVGARLVMFGACILWENMIDKEDYKTVNFQPFLEITGSQLGIFAATVITIIHPVSDLFYYIGMILVYVGMLITLMQVIQRYNLLITRPAPNFHDRGDQSAKMPGALILALIFTACSLALSPAAGLEAAGKRPAVTLTTKEDDPQRIYSVEGRNYEIYIYDEENLLSEKEIGKLVQHMVPITRYGNAGFITYQIEEGDYEGATGDIYNGLFGRSSGTLLMIDMNHRKLVLHSDGDISKVITNSYANTITDNIYRMAGKGNYYGAASEAFREINTLLEGNRIAQPMRHITNGLLAVILSTLILYFVTLLTSLQKKAEAEEILTAIGASIAFSNPKAVFKNRTRVYNPHSSSGGSRSGGGGFGGGGGSSGSHGF